MSRYPLRCPGIKRGAAVKIIDIHGHLGDILNLDGGALIGRKGVVMEKMWDPQTLNENQLNRTFGLGEIIYTLTEHWATKAQRARNFTASLENFRRSLDETGVTYAACLPIAPYVTFEDVLEAAGKESRILPFTSVDFTRQHDIEAKLSSDIGKGARGLKLHPIIQKVPLSDPRTAQALRVCEREKRPVLVHTGVSGYYLGKEKSRNVPAYGRIEHIQRAARDFPGVSFIAGHAGLFQVGELCQSLKGLKNVWVDTSFQSPGIIRKLIKTFGPEKVMYASDWPFGNRPPHIMTVKTACRGDRSLEERLFFKNAAELLGIPD